MTNPQLAQHKEFFAKRDADISTPDFYQRRDTQELVRFINHGVSATVKGNAAVELLQRPDDPAISTELRVQAWRELGNSYAQFGNWPDAARAYDSAIEDAKGSGAPGEIVREIRQSIARCKVGTKEIPEAISILRQVRSEAGPDRPPLERSNDLLVRFHMRWDCGERENALKVLAAYAESLSRRPVQESAAFADCLARECIAALNSQDLKRGFALYKLAKTHVLEPEFVPGELKTTLLYRAFLPCLREGRLDEAERTAREIVRHTVGDPNTDDSALRTAHCALTSVLISRVSYALKHGGADADSYSFEAVTAGRMAGAPMVYEALKTRAHVLAQMEDYAGQIEMLSELITSYSNMGYRHGNGELSDITKQAIIKARLDRVTARWAMNAENPHQVAELCELDLQLAEEMLKTCPEGGAPDLDAAVFKAWYKVERILGDRRGFEDFVEPSDMHDEIVRCRSEPEPEFPLGTLARMTYRVARSISSAPDAPDPAVEKSVRRDIFYGESYSRVLNSLEDWIASDVGSEGDQL